jgi:hypothetical protein
MPVPYDVGLLFRFLDGQAQKLARAPLRNVQATVKVIDHFAHVSLAQKYQNDTNRPIEALYFFPVPASAAVCDFSFVKGDGTTVVGMVKEKRVAQEDYDKALREGKTASLGEEQTKDGKWLYPLSCFLPLIYVWQSSELKLAILLSMNLL